MSELYDTLHAGGLISDESLEKIRQREAKPTLFHIHWEVKTILYVGILLLTTGLGILIYENIDTIGHQFVLMLIAAICVGCFVYCYRVSSPFSKSKVKSPNTAFDYILLLGAISFLTFVGYLQYEYKVFGTNYGLATAVPMLVLFFIAYYFDHLGILNLAIVNLALWMGISVNPWKLISQDIFNSLVITNTYLLLGVLLLVDAYATQQYEFKKHFKFSYQHYGVHAAFISLLAGYFFNYDSIVAVIYLAGLALLACIIYRDSFKNKSFYFLLLVVLYSYIAISSLVMRVLIATSNEGVLFLVPLYFMATGIGLIFVLINFNKKIKAE